MRVALAGGGTAGHVEPALATADALRRAEPDAVVVMLGTARGLETRLVPQRGYDLALIPPVPLPRRPSGDLVRLPWRVRSAVRRCAEVLREWQVEALVGFGGYVALPAYLAARRLHMPLVVHEANVRPGLANRIGARLTRHVAVASDRVALRGGQPVGIPLRPAVAQLDRAAGRATAREHFGLDPDRPVLLAFGGSQGARRINDAVRGALPSIVAAGGQVLHAVGRQNVDAPERTEGYLAVPYLDRMDLAYAAADLALCRAGAITCAELAAVGLPAVYVPLPHGNGEQRFNALPTVRGGGGLLVPDAELTADWLAANVVDLLTDADRVRQMSAAAARLGRRDADDRLVEMIRRAIAEDTTERRPEG